MKNLLLAIALFVTGGSLFSQAKQNSVPLIKSVYTVNSEGVAEDTTNYYYDKQGRCIRVYYSDSYSGYEEKINYPNSSTVVSNKILKKDNETVKTIYSLNKNGLAEAVTRITTRKNDNTVTNDTVNDRIVYNSTGFGIELGDAGCQSCTNEQLKKYNVNIEQLVLVKNGNVLKDARDNMYLYNATIKNTIGNKNKGLNFLGRDNANVMKEQKIPVMNTYSTTTYTYKTDAKGRVSKTVDSQLSGYTTVYIYY